MKKSCVLYSVNTSAVYFSAVANILTQMLLEQLFHPARDWVFGQRDFNQRYIFAVQLQELRPVCL